MLRVSVGVVDVMMACLIREVWRILLGAGEFGVWLKLGVRDTGE